MNNAESVNDLANSNEGLISDDLFYNHLTLGLAKNLPIQKGVHNVNLYKKEATDKSAILNWEQKYSCKLPNDLKNFYLSVESFKMEWDGEYGGETFQIGSMEINPISKLRRIGGFEPNAEGELPPNLDDIDRLVGKRGKPMFKPPCKIFELHACPDNALVCLVYLEYKVTPSIWLLDRSLEWHYIARNFTHYFRMMLVYHGFPEWQFALTSIGLSPSARLLMSGLAPELLSPPTFRKNISDADCRIDPTIFKVRSKMKSSNVSSHAEEKNYEVPEKGGEASGTDPARI